MAHLHKRSMLRKTIVKIVNYFHCVLPNSGALREIENIGQVLCPEIRTCRCLLNPLILSERPALG